MKISELIELLKTFPPDAEFTHPDCTMDTVIPTPDDFSINTNGNVVMWVSGLGCDGYCHQ